MWEIDTQRTYQKKKSTVTLLHTEKHFADRKKRQNRKEKEAKMKVGKKWELVELIWEFKYRKLPTVNKG